VYDGRKARAEVVRYAPWFGLDGEAPFLLAFICSQTKFFIKFFIRRSA